MASNTLWLGLLWILVYIIVIIVGILGNFTVIWIVLAHKRMRTVTNIFLVNLAIAEGLSALFLPIVSTHSITLQWSIGWLICKIMSSWYSVSMFASIFTLCAITFERYMAIIYPLKKRLSGIKTFATIVGIWILSFFLTIPRMIYDKKQQYTKNDGTQHFTCVRNWPNSNLKRAYFTGMLIVSFIVPFVCMVYAYSKIGAALWKSKAVGEQNENQIAKDRGRKKVVKMVIVVTLVFVLCYLPHRIILIVDSILNIVDSRTSNKLYWNIWLGTFILNMAHPACNPIIYCWMSEKFRTGFKKAFKCLSCIKYDPAESDRHL